MHPRDRDNKEKIAPLGADISFIPVSSCQIKKADWVTSTAREIGLGPTLFIMTQKAFMYMFLLLVLINLPLFFFYTKGNGNVDPVLSKNLADKLARMSLGNMGTSDYTCANINVGRNEKTFDLHCPYGTMRSFTEFGLQKVDNQSCSDELGYFVGENGSWDDLQFDCNYENGLTVDGKAALDDAFESKCLDQVECELKIFYYWFN